MNNLMLSQGYHSPTPHSLSQPSHPAFHSLSRAGPANEGLTTCNDRITGSDTSPYVLHRLAGSSSQAPPNGTSSQRQSATESESTLAQIGVMPVPRSLTVHEQDMILHLDRLKHFLATAPSTWSSSTDALVQDPQTAFHPAMNRFLLPSGEFVSCVQWRGQHHITGTDIVRALVFRFDAFGRPVRNLKKFEEGVFCDLRALRPGLDACLEEPKSPFLNLLFKYQCVRTQKKQKVFYWFSVPHDRLFLDALERDLEREKKGLEPTTIIIGEPARSFAYDPERTLYEQFMSSREDGGESPSKLTAIYKTDADGELASDAGASLEPSARVHQPSNAINKQSDPGKQFFNMLSLFDGSPSYKQQRKKAVKTPRWRDTSGGNKTGSESGAELGLQVGEDLVAGTTSSLNTPQNLRSWQGLPARGPWEHSGAKASPFSHISPARRPPYARGPSLRGVAVPRVSLRQHRPEAAANLGGHVDGFRAAPPVSSPLYSDISQQLTNPSISQVPQQYDPVSYPSSLPYVPTSLQDPSQSLVQAPDLYPPAQLQGTPAGMPWTKAYVCPVYSCGRLYRELWYLKEHIRSHTVDEHYRCGRCFKHFSHADNLSQHCQTHVQADNGDHRAILDLERVDEDETMLMGENTCEVEVHGEVEDVAGEPGEIRGLGVVAIYPLNTAKNSVALNSGGKYSEFASLPPSNFPYPGMILKHSSDGSTTQWRAHHGGSKLAASSRGVPPVSRWPNDLDSTWDMPRSQNALGYARDQRGISPSPSPSLVPPIIGKATTLSDVVSLLVEHRCQDLTGTLDPLSYSEYPVSSGGFGDVYKGRLRDGFPIAIKCVRIIVDPSSNEGQKHLKCAAREIHTWSKLRHRYILRFLGLALFREQIAMVSPWVERGSLPTYLRKKPELNRPLLCTQIAEGLAFLHGSGVIHGDLKGANILVSDAGDPLLADFGNAVLNERTLQFTYTTAKSSLSFRWAAPELLDEGSYSVEADVYALGMTILEVITGEMPYCNLKEIQVINAVNKQRHPKRPEEHIPITTQGNLLWSMLGECWAFDPKSRPTAPRVQDVMAVITPEGLVACGESAAQEDQPDTLPT